MGCSLLLLHGHGRQLAALSIIEEAGHPHMARYDPHMESLLSRKIRRIGENY
jgi:hypothetical protein